MNILMSVSRRKDGPLRPTRALLASDDYAAFLAVLSAATRITTASEQVFRDTGISLNTREFDLLVAVDAYGPIRPSDLLRECWMTRSPQTLSSALDRLTHRGLIVRSRHPDDLRGILVDLTAEASSLMDTLFRQIDRRVIGPFRDAFDEDEKRALAELLRRVG